VLGLAYCPLATQRRRVYKNVQKLWKKHASYEYCFAKSAQRRNNIEDTRITTTLSRRPSTVMYNNDDAKVTEISHKMPNTSL